MDYLVKALSLGGLGNKIFKSGDIVSDVNFPPGNIGNLIEGNFLEPLESIEVTSEFEKLVTEISQEPETLEYSGYYNKKN